MNEEINEEGFNEEGFTEQGEIDQRLTNLENMHKFAFVAIAIGLAIFILRK
jgi:hypothetical protein